MPSRTPDPAHSTGRADFLVTCRREENRSSRPSFDRCHRRFAFVRLHPANPRAAKRRDVFDRVASSILHPVAHTCRVERLDRRNRLARREATADILQRFCYNAPRFDRAF
jgi:hypothetical protein